MFYSKSKLALVAGLLLAVGLVISQPAMAQLPTQGQQKRQQVKVEDKELEKFVNIQQKLSPVRRKARQKMSAALKEVGLNQRSYKQIVQKMRNSKSKKDTTVSKEKIKKARKASRKMQTIQKSVQKESRKIIQEEGMSPRRFQKISRAARRDPKLQKRMQKQRKKSK